MRPSTSLAAGPFSHHRYTIKRPFLTIFGRTFRVYGPQGDQVMFVRHKLLTLKDEWNIFTDESEQVPLLRVKARKLLALDAVDDVFDAASGEKLGAVKNRGLKSILRDTYQVLDAGDVVIGHFQEDSNALLRRFLPILLGHWHMEVGGAVVANLDQEFRFFSKEFTLQISGNADPRLVLGCAMLALMREIQREEQE